MASTLGAPAAAPPHWTDAAERHVLDNGLTVLLLPRGDLPIVSVQALYRVGSRNERPGLTGAAHFVEHMAFRSTDGIAKEDMTNQVLRWGGRWNGYTSYDQTVYGSHAPSQHLDWLLFLERERMTRVRFDADEVELERTSVIAELRQYENSPAYTLVEHRLRRAALVAHSYGSPIMGWLSDLRSVSAEDLHDFYREFYAPGNLVLAVVGRFDRDAALGLVRKHFGDLPSGGRSTKLTTVEPAQQGLRRVTTTGPGGAVHVEVVVHAPAASDPAFAALLVLDGVLAGGKAPGRAPVRAGARLHRALVQQGLAYRVTTEVEASEYPGLYSIGVEAAPGADPLAVERAVFAAMDAAGRDVSEEEVAIAQGQIAAALTFAADSNRAMANLLSVYEGLGSFRLLEEIPRRAADETPASVMAFARRHLAEIRRSVGVFVPGPALDDEATPELPADPPASGVVPRLPSQQRPPAATLETPALPAPDHGKLANGLAFLVLPLAGDAVHVRIRVAAGAVDDPQGREGLALLTARLLEAGTVGHPAGVTQPLGRQNIRVQQSATDRDDPASNRDYVEVAATMMRGQLDAALPLLADLVFRPALPEDAVGAGVAALRDEEASRADDTEWRAARAAWTRLFPPTHPYGRPPAGSRDSWERLDREAAAAFHRAFYRPGRVVVAIAGAVQAGEARQAVERAFGSVPSGPGAPARLEVAAAPTGEPGRVTVSMPHKEQASIEVLLPGVARRDPDRVALAALNYLLGETGYAGRLGEVLVDTGIAYSVYASVLADRGPGPIRVTTGAVNPGEAVRRIVAVLDRFARDGVGEAEVREAKGFLLGRLLFRFETPAAATDTLADALMFGAAGDLARFAAAVLRLTPADLSRAAARYYDPARAVIAVAGRS